MRGIVQWAGACALAIGATACGGRTADPLAAVSDETAGDRRFAELTADWTDEARAAQCGSTLRDALATRDLVQGAVDGSAAREIVLGASLEDAKRRIADADTEIEHVRDRLIAGDCDAAVLAAVERAWQLYVQAGAAGVAFARPPR